MTTLLDIDDDVLAAIRHLAQVRQLSEGRILSDLARQTLGEQTAVERNGFHLFPARKGAAPVTLELINRLRDEE